MEEVGLPIDKHRVRYLTTLAPTISRAGLLITPIVAFVLDYSIQVIVNTNDPSSTCQLTAPAPPPPACA